MSPITFCISTWNNLNYLKLAVYSVRKNSYFNNAPFIIHAENCTDGTDQWLEENKEKYKLTYFIGKNEIPIGIGGGMNFCADQVKTEYIMFLHSDFYVSENWDIALLNIAEKYPNEKLWISSHRIEPNMLNSLNRPGTIMVHKDDFGYLHNNFNNVLFEQWAKEFKTINQDIEIPKGEGVSGLIKKQDWINIGGNDPLFAPASYEDMDLFLRMLNNNYKFILTTNSVIWHFGARGSHRLEENNGMSSQRQIESEKNNIKKWINKWGKLPEFDQWGMIKKYE